MRLLHTADWHLGRCLYGRSLLDDQSHILDQIVHLARDLRPDAVLVTGDLFDRATPPAPAIALLRTTLLTLLRECKSTVVLLQGQHDRLASLAPLIKEPGLHLIHTPASALSPVLVEAGNQVMTILSVPYIQAPAAREQLADQTLTSAPEVARALLSRMGDGTRGPTCLAGYMLIEGGQAAGSERPMGPALPLDAVQRFDYVALGHLHLPQALSDRVRYAGSPMALSFSEPSQARSVVFVELPDRGKPRAQLFALEPLRGLRSLEGDTPQLLLDAGAEQVGHDYVKLRVTDREPDLVTLDRLRELYPNLLDVQGPQPAYPDRERSPEELFASFYQEVTGDPLDAARAAAVRAAAGGDP